MCRWNTTNNNQITSTRLYKQTTTYISKMYKNGPQTKAKVRRDWRNYHNATLKFFVVLQTKYQNECPTTYNNLKIILTTKDKIEVGNQSIYEVPCSNCNELYAEQTNRRISVCRDEHANAVKKINTNSSLAQSRRQSTW